MKREKERRKEKFDPREVCILGSIGCPVICRPNNKACDFLFGFQSNNYIISEALNNNYLLSF